MLRKSETKKKSGKFFGVQQFKTRRGNKLRRGWRASWRENGKEVIKVFAIGLRPERDAWLLAMHARKEAEERLPRLFRNKWPELPPVRYKRYFQPKRPDRTVEIVLEELRAYVARCRDSEKQIAKYMGVSYPALLYWLQGRKKPEPDSVKKIRRFLNARL
jgi:hypothetical protein